MTEQMEHLREWPQEQVVSLLVRFNIRLQTALDLRFKLYGVTAQEAALLLFCAEAGETSPGKIATSMGRDKGAITRFIRRLEDAKLVSRMRSGRDRRAFVIRVRKRGERLVPALKIIFEETRAKLFEEIPDAERDRLGAAVAQMYDNAGEL